MRDAFFTYFTAEKQSGLLACCAGAASIAFAALLFSHARAFALTMLLLGLGEIAMGVGFYVRNRGRIERLAPLLDEGTRLQADELPRMTKTQAGFPRFEWAWVGLLAGAGVAAVALRHRPTAAVVAAAFVVHLGALLAFDVFAERRGAVYLEVLRATR